MSTESPLQLTEREFTIDTTAFNEESLQKNIQGRLRYYYSRRLFVQSVDYDPEGHFLSVTVGITYPQDVSDSRSDDHVLKMVNIGDVETLTASAVGQNYYKFDLPSRAELYSSYQDRHENMLDELDWSMAKAIYSRVYQLNPVRNQLNSIVQIVNWVRREDELTIEDIEDAQSNKNTREYIQALEDLGFLRVEGNKVSDGRKIDSADLQNLSSKEFEQKVIGDIVVDGYYMLRKELKLRMLNHFPVFANAYYISAFRRQKPDLWLTVEDVTETLNEEYDRDEGRLAVEDKLRDLARVGVLEFDNGEVCGHPDIYEAVQKDAPVIG